MGMTLRTNAKMFRPNSQQGGNLLAMLTSTTRSTVSPAGASTLQANNACESCKKRKSRCDKILPRCTLCESRDWDCNYEWNTAIPNILSGSTQHSNVLSIRDSHEPLPDNFPRHYFLDADLFEESLLTLPQLPTIGLSLTSINFDDTAERRAVTATYFDTIHDWMPIISKRLFNSTLLNPTEFNKADNLLLYMCMKLINWVPREASDDARSSLYFEAKSLHLNLEVSGYVTCKSLQAGILTALYEIGHGIYPAAYMSVGSCVRYANALGIRGDENIDTTNQKQWIEMEERRRIWWSLVILERFLCLGRPNQTLLLDNPDSSALLPADDTAWDRGIISPGSGLVVHSLDEINLGRFARTAQATHLLGQVLRHVSRRQNGLLLDDGETVQLDRTINALIRMTEIVVIDRHIKLCCQTAICYSALALLHSNAYQLHSTTHISAITAPYVQASLLKLCNTNIELAQRLQAGLATPIEGWSYFTMHWTYHAATCLISMRHLWPTNQLESGFELIKSKLLSGGRRWKLAFTYLELIEMREMMYLSQS